MVLKLWWDEWWNVWRKEWWDSWCNGWFYLKKKELQKKIRIIIQLFHFCFNQFNWFVHLSNKIKTFHPIGRSALYFTDEVDKFSLINSISGPELINQKLINHVMIHEVITKKAINFGMVIRRKALHNLMCMHIRPTNHTNVWIGFFSNFQIFFEFENFLSGWVRYLGCQQDLHPNTDRMEFRTFLSFFCRS